MFHINGSLRIGKTGHTRALLPFRHLGARTEELQRMPHLTEYYSAISLFLQAFRLRLGRRNTE